MVNIWEKIFHISSLNLYRIEYLHFPPHHFGDIREQILTNHGSKNPLDQYLHQCTNDVLSVEISIKTGMHMIVSLHVLQLKLTLEPLVPLYFVDSLSRFWRSRMLLSEIIHYNEIIHWTWVVSLTGLLWNFSIRINSIENLNVSLSKKQESLSRSRD